MAGSRRAGLGQVWVSGGAGDGRAAAQMRANECLWERAQLPEAIRELVLDDQRLRNDICWSVFDC